LVVAVEVPADVAYDSVLVVFKQTRAGAVINQYSTFLPPIKKVTYTWESVWANDILTCYASSPITTQPKWEGTISAAEAAQPPHTAGLTLALEKVAAPEVPVSFKDLADAMSKEREERTTADLATVGASVAEMNKVLEARKLWSTLEEGTAAAKYAKDKIDDANKELKSIWDQLAEIPGKIVDSGWAIIEDFVGMILNGVMSGVENGLQDVDAETTALHRKNMGEVG
jgi:hypothetical protein